MILSSALIFLHEETENVRAAVPYFPNFTH